MGKYDCCILLLCQLQLCYESAWIYVLWGEKAGMYIVVEKPNLKQGNSHLLTRSVAVAVLGGSVWREVLGT